MTISQSGVWPTSAEPEQAVCCDREYSYEIKALFSSPGLKQMKYYSFIRFSLCPCLFFAILYPVASYRTLTSSPQSAKVTPFKHKTVEIQLQCLIYMSVFQSLDSNGFCVCFEHPKHEILPFHTEENLSEERASRHHKRQSLPFHRDKLARLKRQDPLGLACVWPSVCCRWISKETCFSFGLVCCQTVSVESVCKNKSICVRRTKCSQLLVDL